MMAKQKVNKFFGEDKQLLKLAFESIAKSLLKDPFRLQSFFEYALSLVSLSPSSCFVNGNSSHDGQLSVYGQPYLSPDYEADCKQVERLRNMILDESEKIYDKKIEELTNRTISGNVKL